MSDTELNIGTLTPTGKTIAEYCSEVGLKNQTCFDTIEEYFNDEYHEKAHVINGEVYEMEYKNHEYDDIYIARRNGKQIEFIVKFYNGASPMSEALDEAIKTLEIEETK